VAYTAAIYRDPVAAETAVAHRVAAVTSAAMTSATAVTSAASCERDCAGRRCRYAEHDSGSRCNYLLAHLYKLLMFHPQLTCDTLSGLLKRWRTRSHRSPIGKTVIRSSTSTQASFADWRSVIASRLLPSFQIGALRTNRSNTTRRSRTQ
jgi:hypothetical protein